jgi:hypothetical protein
MKSVLFTDEEIVWANQLLDVALKTLGRQAIQPFVAIVNKLAMAQDVPEQEAAEKTTQEGA